MQTESSNSTGHMTHPSREAWMDFVYDELPAREHAQLDAHLQTCPVCQREVARWRGTLAALDIDRIPVRQARPAVPAWKWAAAAAFVLGALGMAFGYGRMGAASDLQTLRVELREQQAQAESANRVLRQLLVEYAEAAEAKRVDDQQTLLNAVHTLDAARRADILGLRQDLETVAVNTASGLRLTEQQLMQLAAASQAGVHPE